MGIVPCMELTVCLCTHNRPRYVRDCLDGLDRQTEPRGRFRTLVVDSGSSQTVHAALRRLVGQFPDTVLIRLDEPGVSLARNAGAAACETRFIAYIDDDAVPDPTWVAAILHTLQEAGPLPAAIGGRILPKWEAPLPAWWPASLRGVLSIIEHEGRGEYRTPNLPEKLEPYAANMIVDARALLKAGGFGVCLGRAGATLLSDEEVQLAWRLQDAGLSVRYDSRIVVHHQIQATRFRPEWLLARLYWQGVSTVLTRKTLGYRMKVWKELPRRLAVALLCAPAALIPKSSTRLLAVRWRFAYAAGFLKAAFGP
jgi:glycosyltransferase involved in cell wall biosynthesis